MTFSLICAVAQPLNRTRLWDWLDLGLAKIEKLEGVVGLCKVFEQ